MGNCLTRDLYWQTLSNNNKEPHFTTHFWKKMFNINDEDLAKIYYKPYSYSRECKIQSLQYKILHNIYPTRYRKKCWKINLDDQCLTCNEVDTLEHHFCTCRKMKIFWSSLNGWWNTLCSNCKISESQHILLGIKLNKCHKYQLNFICLHAKWYIYRTKHLEREINFLEFLPEL